MNAGALSVTGISFLMLFVFAVAFSGYALGRVSIGGVRLGTAGVFIAALLFGCFFYDPLSAQLRLGDTDYTASALKIIENTGLILFVSSVGFIAGPGFFAGFRRNIKSYVALGALLILTSALMCVLCVVLFGCDAPMAVGILSGALTSTPAFSAAKETVAIVYKDPNTARIMEEMVTVGHGIAYLFGVVSKVLFVQLVPRIEGADMAEERKKLKATSDDRPARGNEGRFRLDRFGFGAFSLSVVCGMIVGGVKLPMGHSAFSLGTTGGALLAALVIAHFGHIGPLDMKVDKRALDVFRELGLMLFLVGAGIPGGARFAQYFRIEYFLYGILMTVVPLFVGYLFARKALRLGMLNSLGSITGGMTSTPALGMLISVAGTDDVAAAYAATYPVALVLVVLVSQFVIMLFP